MSVQQTGQIDFHTVKAGPIKGLRIKLRRVQPLLLSKVMKSIALPSRPTYETRTASGKTQIHPMDEQSAKETPGGETEWQYYLEETERALSEQNDRVVSAILAMGTDCDVDEDGDWRTVQEAMGIEIPRQKDQLRAHYLMTMIEDPNELNEMVSKIMRLTGVDEEVIQQAEDSFRDSVRDRPETAGSVANTNGHQAEITERDVAAQ